jgi:chemotaxis protein methyltransferase CheR
MTEPNDTIAGQDADIRLLLEAIFENYGYDFRNYAPATIERRISRNLALSGYSSIAELHRHIIDNPQCFENLLLDMSINVTEMFRDPSFFKAVRERIVPTLKDLPQINIWLAGCASGEEVYSTAILFREEGLDGKIRIVATDFNRHILNTAEQGVYPASEMKKFSLNYLLAGGKASLNDYVTQKNPYIVVSDSLKKNIRFVHHNLVSDGPLEAMGMIFCRNVLIYFNRELQNRVFGTFRNSLSDMGYLCLGPGESLRFSTCLKDFDAIVPKEKIYRKIPLR